MTYDSAVKNMKTKIEQAINQFQLDTGHFVHSIAIVRTPPLASFQAEFVITKDLS